MYEFIIGTVVECQENRVIVEQGGIGFVLFASLSSISKVTVGEKRCFYVQLVVREDSHTLYGFLSKDERSLFEAIQSVSGIGAKTALSILGSLSPSRLSQAIQDGDKKLLCQIPGIGGKTAERMILELRDKVARFIQESAPQGAIQDVYQALIKLGFSLSQIDPAYQSLCKKEPSIPSQTPQEILKKILATLKQPLTWSP